MADLAHISLVEFSARPGGRYRKDFEHSGEQFYEEKVEPALRAGKSVVITVDGVVGVPPSFWSEVFKRTYDAFGISAARSVVVTAKVSTHLVEEAEKARKKTLQKLGA